MQSSLQGKKLLILGGSYQHRKVVTAAKSMGIITYVTDYLPVEESPAKQMADVKCMVNITDIDGLVSLCKKESIDGVIGPYLDVTQIPYQKVCETLNFPCFGNLQQHVILTDKTVFKEFCEKNGADVIPYYQEDNIYEEEIEYPILIKPSDSRGSRGQSICHTKEDISRALEFAKSESVSGKVIIEKYMGKASDIQLVYMVINGEPYLLKVEDRILGSVENGFDKLCIASMTPSNFESMYLEEADKKVRSMIKSTGLKNAPVFIQAFMDDEKARLYDPGLRMPGDDYDEAFKLDTGIDIPALLVKFALTGNMDQEISQKIRNFKMHKISALIMPCLKPGKIKKIDGLDQLLKNPCVVEYSVNHTVGEYIQETKNVKQRFGEFVLSCENNVEFWTTVNWLFKTVKVFDENDNDMLIEKLSIEMR